MPSSCLFLVSVDGVASDADAVGGPGGIDGDRQPADKGDSWGRTVLQLDVQGRIRRTCRPSESQTRDGDDCKTLSRRKHKGVLTLQKTWALISITEEMLSIITTAKGKNKIRSHIPAVPDCWHET